MQTQANTLKGKIQSLNSSSFNYDSPIDAASPTGTIASIIPTYLGGSSSRKVKDVLDQILQVNDPIIFGTSSPYPFLEQFQNFNSYEPSF